MIYVIDPDLNNTKNITLKHQRMKTQYSTLNLFKVILSNTVYLEPFSSVFLSCCPVFSGQMGDSNLQSFNLHQIQ